MGRVFRIGFGYQIQKYELRLLAVTSAKENEVIKGSVKRMAALVTVATLIACANPGIVQLSPDTYLLTRTDRAGMFGNASKMKADVLREAAEFAESRDKVAVTVLLRETPMRVGQCASIEYQFRLVDKNDPEATSARAPLIPQPEVGTENTENINLDIHTDDDDEKDGDIYAQLLKLDDLRQRGILTDAEFDAEKRKLLEGN